MVVTIIAISVLVFSPALSLAMEHRRISSAAKELIRIGRRARTDTFSLLRAHLLWIDTPNKKAQLLRAPINSCTLTNWTNVQSDCPSSGAPAGRCVEQLNILNIVVDPNILFYEEKLDGTKPTTPRAICFAPSGLTYSGTGSNLAAVTLSSANSSAINGGFVMTLQWQNVGPNGDASRFHRVLFPLGGTARAYR